MLEIVVSDGVSKTSISSIYYINLNSGSNRDSNISAIDRKYELNNYDNKYKKTEDTMVEYYFDNDLILNEIKKAGYRYLITTDGNFTPISSINDQNRMHIIAIKRETN